MNNDTGFSRQNADNSRDVSFTFRGSPALHTPINHPRAKKLVDLQVISKDLQESFAAFTRLGELLIDITNGGIDVPVASNTEQPAAAVYLHSLACAGFMAYARAFGRNGIEKRELFKAELAELMPLHEWAEDTMRHSYYAHTNKNDFDAPLVAALTPMLRSDPFFLAGIVNVSYVRWIDSDTVSDMLLLVETALQYNTARVRKSMASFERFLGTLPIEAILAGARVATRIPPPPAPPRISDEFRRQLARRD